MLLEEGHARSDDADARKKARRSGVAVVGRYERWARAVTIGVFGAWMLLVLVYYSGRHGSTMAGGVSRSGGRAAGRAVGNAATYEDAFPEATNFLVIGDYGTGDDSQRQVALTLESFASALDPPPAFVLSTGDQVYDHGYGSGLCRIVADGRCEWLTLRSSAVSSRPRTRCSPRASSRFARELLVSGCHFRASPANEWRMRCRPAIRCTRTRVCKSRGTSCTSCNNSRWWCTQRLAGY